MRECEIKIINKLGLHARAAAKLVKLCSTFESSIEMDKNIMGVMMLAASCDTVVTVRTQGEDEIEAINAVRELIEDRFGEDE